MRRNLQRMMVALAAMMICLGASAIDKVIKKSEMTGEVTSVEDLASSTFMLQNGEGNEAVVLYTPSGWDIKVASLVTAVSKNDNGGYYKLEAIGDHYLIPVFNINKSVRTFWTGAQQYVNSQPVSMGTVIFGLSGAAPQYGQDAQDHALWDITYEEGQGFVFHCVGRDIYIGHNGTAAFASSDVFYWKAYTGYILGYDETEVLAAYEVVAAAVKTTDTSTALSNAKATYDGGGSLDAFGDAVNAAIDAVNECEAINATYANLEGDAATIAADVLDQYNNGVFANAAGLRTAYIAAIKAQTAPGSDFTGAIINPSFETGNIDGWTSNNCGNVANNYNFGARTGDKFCERWTGTSGTLSDGTFLQTLSGLPNGKYKLTAEMQNREQGNGDAAGKGFFLVANEGKTEGVTNNGATITTFGIVTEGTLEIGVKLEGCTGNWICFDNFQLTYLGALATDEEMKDLTAEIATAKALGVDVTAYETTVFAASEISAAVEALKVAEYVQVNTDYTQNAAVLIPDFSKWEGGMVSNKGQHWDGTGTSTYYEQTGAQWGESSWTNNKKTTVTLPKGQYVLYAAGRASAGTACTAYIKVNEEIRNFPSKGDVGFGVATDGTAAFDPETATFANGNKGRGFEYRYIAFEVTNDAGEEITLEIGGEATANHQWMSVTAPVLLTTADNSAIIKQVLAADIEIAQAIVDAKAGVGDGIFMIPTEALNGFANAVYDAKAVNENTEATAEEIQNAITALALATQTYNAIAVNTPDPDKLYTFQLKVDGETPLYMNLTDGVKIQEEATPLAFVAAETAGQYYLDAEGELSVGRDGSNNWTMSTSAEKRIAWSFTALGNGEYNINNLVTAGRFVGTNNNEKTAGSPCYCDKQTSNGNVVWIIAEYVAPEPVDPNDYTNMIVNADLKGEGGFDDAGTKGINGSGIVKVGNAAEFDFKQTIANLPAGQYKLTAQAAYRYGADEAAEAAAINEGTDTKLVQLYATVGEKTVATPVQNRYDGASDTDLFGQENNQGVSVVNEKFVPNSSDAVQAWFAAGQYVNEVIFNLPADGAVTIGINRTGTPESDYTVIGPWTLYRLGDAEPEPEIATFTGIVEQNLYGPSDDGLTLMGTTTTEQTVKIAEAGEGLVNITFSGFTTPMMPFTFPEFTISNVAADVAGDGSIAYAAGNFQVATSGGMMTSYYNGTLEGVQVSAEATPCFKLVLQNATTDEVYFGADQNAIDAYKASFEPEPEPIDPNLIEIAQEQSPEIQDNATRAAVEEGDGYTQYTTDGDVCVIVKMYDVDVTDCDYVVVKFAEPIPNGIRAAFWSQSGKASVELDPGISEYKYVFAEDDNCAIQNGILPQLTLLTLWSAQTVKIAGIYKHKVEPTVPEIAIDVDRVAGMGYSADAVTYNESEILEALGIASWDDIETKYPVVMTTGEAGTDYDGWRNVAGDPASWNGEGTDLGLCLKYPHDGSFALCTHPGNDPEVGTTLSAAWILGAGEKSVIVKVNVAFIEQPVTDFAFDDLNQIGEDIVVPFESEPGSSYEAYTASVDVAGILTSLGAASLSDVTIYAVLSDGSLDSNYKLGLTDGWRNAAGDWQGWGSDARLCVKTDFAAAENQIYYVGGMDGQTSEAASYTATFAFVNNASATHDAVVLKVTLTYAVPDGINAIEIAKAKGNGKYLNKKGQIIIVNDKKAFSLTGAEMK